MALPLSLARHESGTYWVIGLPRKIETGKNRTLVQVNAESTPTAKNFAELCHVTNLRICRRPGVAPAAGFSHYRRLVASGELSVRWDHNGFSHQDPGFVDHVSNKKANTVRVYLPPGANCLL
jgi:D-xylulose 5-phosphate/D-fructose 6-phosphate phosphoketolase